MLRSIRTASRPVSPLSFLNVRAGLAGAAIMGSIVWLINVDHGGVAAMIAAMKQAAYTFLLGGLLIRMLERIVSAIRKRRRAIFISSFAVSLLTILLVFLVHRLKGTPEPILSTLPTVVLAPPGFLALAWRKRNKVERAPSPRHAEQGTII